MYIYSNNNNKIIQILKQSALENLLKKTTTTSRQNNVIKERTNRNKNILTSAIFVLSIYDFIRDNFE